MSNNRNRNRNRNGRPRPQEQSDSHVQRILPFRFQHDGETFELPPAKNGTEALTGGDLIDAAMGDELGQVRFFIKMLEAAGPSREAMAALRAMPIPRFSNVMSEWMKRSGAHPGKSGPSSN
jgi:hypothetical protein